MMSLQIKSVIIAIISKQFSVDAAEITEYTDIADDLDADSLDVVELLMEIEDEFGVCIPDADVFTMKTVQDIVDYISSRDPEPNPVLNISNT
jgi:acyl carrier protein